MFSEKRVVGPDTDTDPDPDTDPEKIIPDPDSSGLEMNLK
jgi:hypothetical protein